MRQVITLYETSSGLRLNGVENEQPVGNVKMRVLDIDIPNLSSMRLHEFIEKRKDYSKNDWILILNKGCFQFEHLILQLIDDGYTLIADMVDHRPEPRYNSLMDGFISSSVGQHAYLKQITDKPIWYVIHGYDKDFSLTLPPDDFRLCYIGASDSVPRIEMVQQSMTWINSCDWFRKEYWTDDWFSQLSKKERTLMERRESGEWMKVVQPYIKPITQEWKKEIKDYSCHWGLRYHDPYAPFKPFTKGFTASVFSCPIMVDSFNYDARYYLPKDYPFFTDTEKQITTQEGVDFYVEKLKKGYKTEQWDYALECMSNLYEKCNHTKVLERWEEVVEKIKKRFK